VIEGFILAVFFILLETACTFRQPQKKNAGFTPSKEE
jgi:hypothetical protein